MNGKMPEHNKPPLQLINFTETQTPNYTPVIDPVPIPIAPYGENLIPMCLDRNYLPYMAAAMNVYAQRDAWADTEENQIWAKNQIGQLVVALLQKVYCMDFQFRNKPTDACIVQFSQNGGETWADAWDMSLCQPQNVYNDMFFYNDLDLIYNSYDGTPTSVDNDAPTEFTGNPEDETDDPILRDLALCAAARAVVLVAAQAEQEKRAGVTGLAQTVAAILASPTVFNAVPPQVKVFLGITSIVLGAAATIFQTLSDAVLSDDEALENVGCCLYRNLRTTENTRTGFANSLDSCDFDSGSIEEQLRGAVAYLLAQGEMYIYFTKGLGEFYRFAKQGLLADCPCHCEFTVDFETEGYPYEIIHGTKTFLEVGFNASIDGATYTDGEQHGDRAVVQFDTGCFVAGVDLEFSFAHGSANNNIGLRCTLYDGVTIVDEEDIVGSYSKNTVHTHTFNVVAQCTHVEVSLAFQNTIEDDDKFVRMYNIMVNSA